MNTAAVVSGERREAPQLSRVYEQDVPCSVDLVYAGLASTCLRRKYSAPIAPRRPRGVGSGCGRRVLSGVGGDVAVDVWEATACSRVVVSFVLFVCFVCLNRDRDRIG